MWWYKYDILYIEEWDARYICNLEYMMKAQHKEHKYIPKKKFGGMHECYSKILFEY